jgi:Leucine rich repeat
LNSQALHPVDDVTIHSKSKGSARNSRLDGRDIGANGGIDLESRNCADARERIDDDDCDIREGNSTASSSSSRSTTTSDGAFVYIRKKDQNLSPTSTVSSISYNDWSTRSGRDSSKESPTSSGQRRLKLGTKIASSALGDLFEKDEEEIIFFETEEEEFVLFEREGETVSFERHAGGTVAFEREARGIVFSERDEGETDWFQRQDEEICFESKSSSENESTTESSLHDAPSLLPLDDGALSCFEEGKAEGFYHEHNRNSVTNPTDSLSTEENIMASSKRHNEIEVPQGIAEERQGWVHSEGLGIMSLTSRITRRIHSRKTQLFYGAVAGDNNHNVGDRTLLQSPTGLSSDDTGVFEACMGRSPCSAKRKSFVWFLVMVSFIGMAVVGAVLLFIDARATSSDGEFEITDTDTESSVEYPDTREQLLRTFLGSLSGTDALGNSSTPQYSALEWLVKKDDARIDLQSSRYETVIERYVAVLLYFATSGDEWESRLGFLSRDSVCGWNRFNMGAFANASFHHGIACNDAGNIISIDLTRNGISGELPWELASLQSLQELRIPRNHLKSNLPTQIGLLTNLRVLDLAGNSLEGSIPSEMGWMVQMKRMKMRFNKFSGSIPTQFGAMTNIAHLDLSHNRLTGSLPSELGALSRLQYLDVSRNFLKGSIPSDLGGRAYENFDVTGNRFVGNLTSDFCMIEGSSKTSIEINIVADCEGPNATIYCSCCKCCHQGMGCDAER